MSSILLIEVHFAGTTVMRVADKTLEQVIENLITNPHYQDNQPLYIHFPSTGKKIYWDYWTFHNYYTKQSETKIEEIVEKLQCEALLRNNTDIATEHAFIDQDSLWMLRNKKCILIDDDQHIEIAFEAEIFYNA